uniref:Interleukin-6 n=1 Tax=Fundulus heteroclitus TaxID=8078 RepID=A0A3Q2Q433_FUNHE
MSSKLNLRLLAAVMLAAALPLCVKGAPLEVTPTDLPQGEASGEEEEDRRISDPPRDSNIIEIWERVLKSTESHQQEFDEEFQGNVKYDLLDKDKPRSFPAKCPNCTLSKEACLQSLAHGMLVYTVLLKHVDREYHNSSIVAAVKAGIPQLITQIKAKMRNADSVAAPTSSEEQQLLKELDRPDLFYRKMMAHRILRSIHIFLVDGKRSYQKWMSKKKPESFYISKPKHQEYTKTVA